VRRLPNTVAGGVKWRVVDAYLGSANRLGASMGRVTLLAVSALAVVSAAAAESTPGIPEVVSPNVTRRQVPQDKIPNWSNSSRTKYAYRDRAGCRISQLPGNFSCLRDLLDAFPVRGYCLTESNLTHASVQTLVPVDLRWFTQRVTRRKQRYAEKKSNQDPTRKGNNQEYEAHLQIRVPKCSKCINAGTDEHDS